MDLTKKNYEIIAEELQRIIESGIIKPGEKLDTIENLAKQYHVGRSTIREALSHLKARGLIETKQGGGTYVLQSLDKKLEIAAQIDDFKELLEVRKILELGCIELAAMNRTNENIQELTRIVEQMEDAVGNEEISQVYDVNFHLAIARASQNHLLQKMMESISSSMIRTIRDSRKLWMYSESQTAPRLFEEHQKMLEAIIEQDVQLGIVTMSKHLQKVESVVKS
ncbi:MAG TPA: FadR/GntR family transcriptional regulator [Bacillota bacterium]|nr:FadR/GntR family transcriptional regulator [Bacillota bacterium]